MMSPPDILLPAGAWAFSTTHQQVVRILDVEKIWNQVIYQVWIPGLSKVERIPSSCLTDSQPRDTSALDRAVYISAAAKISNTLTQDILLAPLEAGVIPLPHQLYALGKAMSNDRIRYLLADEVGLGKTIEAGLVFRELKLRGLVNRVLVVAPKGLVTQWVQEMKTHFGEEFRLLTPIEFSARRNFGSTENIWKQFDQVVCPLDSIKPIEKRRGWTNEKLEAYNQERLGDLIEAGWDLIICDEAHRLGGSTEQVARFRLGKALSDAAPYFLLLSATPHQGKSDAFQRLMSLLDAEEFIGTDAIIKEKVIPYVIRTEKRQSINERGEPLFLPRTTKLVKVQWQQKHALQRQLYEAVTDYVRIGYNQAIRQKRNYLGFLMILMQRLVTSSTRAIRLSLERRLEALKTNVPPNEEELAETSFDEQDGQEQLEELLARVAGMQNEQEEVSLLLDTARQCEAQGPDARAEALLDILYKRQQEENNPDLKYLIFTEFVPTQNMLRNFLEQHGFSVVILNGSMELDQRRAVQRQFAEKVRILISTDAGGEGLNLQFAHIIINYDLPWNPMRIEQRIGRVDRIGQKFPVFAFNLILEESVEMRVQEVLEQKLATILNEFGVDKTEDVLDSAESNAIFEKLYAQAIVSPTDFDKNLNAAMKEIRQKAQQENKGRSLYGQNTLDPTLAQQLSSHPLPYWVERMAIAYVRHKGGSVHKDLLGFNLEWPDGTRLHHVSFHAKEAQDRGLTHVNLEDSRIRKLISMLPRAPLNEAIPTIQFLDLPAEIGGYWTLWQIALDTALSRGTKVMPLFHHDSGKVYLPTASHIWEALLAEEPAVKLLEANASISVKSIFDRLRMDAELHGEPIYKELVADHLRKLQREDTKRNFAFRVRREALNRIGLPEVRQHRLNRLAEEEKAWHIDLARRQRVIPELQLVLVLRVEAVHD